MQIQFVKVGKEDFPALEKLAVRLWHSAFDNLIGPEQADYMLEKFQSASAFARQTEEEGYEYYFIVCDGVTAGYTGIAAKKGEDNLFLSKLYLAPEFWGMGLGRAGRQFVKDTAANRGLRSVYLTVNKGNERAIKVYEKFGFVRTDSTVTDIGGGYVMDDFVYTLKV